MSATPSPAELEHIVYGDNCPPNGIPRPVTCRHCGNGIDIVTDECVGCGLPDRPMRAQGLVMVVCAAFWALLIWAVRS